MAKSIAWQLMHLICILAHIIMLVAGGVLLFVNGMNQKLYSQTNEAAYPWIIFATVYSSLLDDTVPR